MKKRLLCAFLVSSMVLGSCNTYAEESSVSSDTYIAPDGAGQDVTVSSQAAEPTVNYIASSSVITADTNESSDADGNTLINTAPQISTAKDEETSGAAINVTEISAYATDTTFTEIEQTDVNGVNYTLTMKYNYVFNNEICCQITNISKDVQCEAVIPPEVEITMPDGSKVTRKVRSVAGSAFEAAKVTSVTLPETIREIGAKAFLNCSNIKTLNINGKLYATRQMPEPIVDNNGKYIYTAKIDSNGAIVYDKYGNAVYDYQTDANGDIIYYETIDSSNINTTTKRTVVTEIGSNAFQGCTALENVYISGFQKVGDSVFNGCTSLKSVKFSTDEMYQVTVSKIDNSEFNIVSGKIATSPLPIVLGKNTFENCTALEELTLDNSITTLGIETFKGCSSLKKLTVGSGLTSTLNVASFTGCTAMEIVEVNANNKTFTAIDGILYKGTPLKPSSLEYCPPMNKIISTDADGNTVGTAGTLDLPATVTTIAAKAVNNNLYIKELIASNAININASAFADCRSLQQINMYNQATIGASAFKNCEALFNINHTYNEGTKPSTIGANAFEGCTGLTNLDLYGWADIGVAAFKGCTGLTNVEAIMGVGSIGNNCFEGCTALKNADMTYAGIGVIGTTKQLTFGVYIFKDCVLLEKANLPIGLLGLSTGTFQNCTSLTTVTSGDNLGKIENLAFDNCPLLVNPPTPRFLVRINKNAFKGCTALNNYQMTRSVLIIEDGAFSGCPNIAFSAPNNSKAYEYAAKNNINCNVIADDILDEEFLVFENGRITGYRGGFESLTIPDDYFTKRGVTSENLWLGKSWINNPLSGSTCSMKPYLKHLDLGPVNVIGPSALLGATLLDADLGSAKYIFGSAFSNCTSLVKANIPSTTEVMDSSVFSGCKSLETIVIEAPEVTGVEYDGEIPVLKSIDDVNTIKFFTLKDNESIGTITVNTTASKGQFANCTSLQNLDIQTTTIHTDSTDKEERKKDKQVSKFSDIPETCFNGCIALTELTVPYNCKSIGKSAFAGCKTLVNAKFSPLTETIGELAFDNCSAYKTVTLPHNVTVGTNAFRGCTAIDRIIIPQTAKLAISDTPFINTYGATVICDKTSNNLTYFQAFNDPENNLDKFMNESTAKSYVGKYHYNIEYGEFVDGIDYVIVKGKITIPDGVHVTKNGTDIKTGDYVIGGDVLTIIADDPELQNAISVNGVPIPEDGIYTVPENENIKITVSVVKGMYGDVNYDSSITAADAALTLQHSLSPCLDADTIILADVNTDGSITASDAATILQKALDSSFVFPVENK